MEEIKIALIYAHPSRSEGSSAKILERVLSVLSSSGAQCRILDLYADNFNPVLDAAELREYSSRKPPKSDIANYQKAISESEALIFIYPAWWSVPPAILKGWLDRVFTPGFAFSFSSGVMKGLLEGKRALVLRTFASGAESEQAIGHVASNFMEKAVLGACGIKSSSVDLYSMESLDPTTFAHYLFQIEGAVRRLLARPSAVPHHLRWIPAPHLPPIEQKIPQKKIGPGSDMLLQGKQKLPQKSAHAPLGASPIQHQMQAWGGGGQQKFGQAPQQQKNAGARQPQTWGGRQQKNWNEQSRIHRSGEPQGGHRVGEKHGGTGQKFGGKQAQGRPDRREKRKHFRDESFKRTKNYYGRQS